MEVVILILKHATILRLSKSPEDALTLAEQDYQKAKINSKIQEHVKAFTLEDSVEQFADFIMDINIGLFINSFITIISHLSLDPKQLHREDHRWEQFWGPICMQSMSNTRSRRFKVE